ncbi:MAG: efflux transporter periplasmic adaptor subunit [Deltaproteobacteria bacterium HGW-Deltaproteobacteria-8]|jgi:RND family efflux transporter MFP subunit|nr:MAG: efflux transporter periplasmic adaptor subunit [Deltaproteobacteria bacterium HGW-Deltaproteobacteria-8]
MTRKKLLYIALALLLAAGGFYYYKKGRATGATRVLATATVARGQVRRVLEATGIIKAQVGASVKIGARATGAISRIYLRVGDPVKKGQIVAEIDARELEAQRQEAAARLRVAEAKAQYAAQTLPRNEALTSQGMQAQSILDETRQNYKVARADAAAARAALATLDVRISYTRIVSPIDGVVSQVTAQEGETIVAGLQVANLVTVLDPSRLEMWIYVDETDVGRVKTGLPVEFRVDSQPGKTFTGTLDRVYPEPEIRDNIVYYKPLVTVDREQALLLRPEMTTQCSVVVDTRENVLTVPNQALKWVGGGQTVFVVDKAAPGGVRAVAPKLGLPGLEQSEVLEGLQEGDVVATQIVLSGNEKPAESAPVPDKAAGPKPGKPGQSGKKGG